MIYKNIFIIEKKSFLKVSKVMVTGTSYTMGKEEKE